MSEIKARAVHLLLLSVVLAGIGCGGAGLPTQPPQAEDVLPLFGARIGPVPAAGGREVRPLDLYVDASGSMRGFVARPDSVFRNALGSLLDRASTSGYELSVFGFADRVSRPLGNIGASSILTPAFYSGGETSFPELAKSILRGHDSGAVSVVVSDLVQSGRTGDQRALASAFQGLAEKKPEVLLLAFRSAFEGRYFVEGANRGSVLKLSLDGTSDEKSRPFYVLIVAPNRVELDRVKRFLFPEVIAGEELDATRPGVALEQVEYLPAGEGEPPVWNTYRMPEALPMNSLTPRSVLSFLEISAPSGRRSPLRLGFTVKDENPSRLGTVREAGHFGFLVQRRLLRAGQWKTVEAIDLAPEALFSRNGKTMTLSYSFPRPDPFSWDAYRIRLMPGDGNLRLPLWVEDWTAADDSLAVLGNRTLKLDLFVEAMVRSIQEQVPLSEHYILLGRGE